MTQEALQDSPKKNRTRQVETNTNPATETIETRSSTLIEFPGSSRAVPEWRKQLSQRVREVQERKAREAAEELAAAQEAGKVSCALPSGQLELVPEVDPSVMNPIVSKALERLDRARRVEIVTPRLTAVAAAPARVQVLEPTIEIEEDEVEALPDVAAIEDIEKPQLTVVSPPSLNARPSNAQRSLEPQPLLAQIPTDVEEVLEPLRQRKTVRVISEDDVALSYLETCLSVPALEADTRRDLPGFPRRIIAGALDLLFLALMVSPAVAAVYYTGSQWSNPRVIGLLSGVTAVTMFTYLTITVALTGRTLAMRMFSLRAIDLRTGLIPTGGQAIRRAIAQVFSLAFLGLGLLYAFIDRDHRTVHDRLSNTIVVRI